MRVLHVPVATDVLWNRGDIDRKSTRLNSSHTEIYTLSLHDALPIYFTQYKLSEKPENRTPGDLQAAALIRISFAPATGLRNFSSNSHSRFFASTKCACFTCP